MTEWMTLVGVIIAAGATLAVQLLINHGESSAIKRIKLLNEAIDGVAGDEKARQALIGARGKLVAKLAAPPAGIEGFARWLRVSAWAALCVGSGALLLALIVLGVMGSDSALMPLAAQGFQIGFLLVILAPLLLIYSALWPSLVADVRYFGRSFADKRITRGYRKIREALEVDVHGDFGTGPGATGAVAR